jgi:hypothetical protein
MEENCYLIQITALSKAIAVDCKERDDVGGASEENMKFCRLDGLVSLLSQ